jgi:hypothetical protein
MDGDLVAMIVKGNAELEARVDGELVATADGPGNAFDVDDEDEEDDEDESLGFEVETEFTAQVTDGTYVVIDKLKLPEAGFMSIHEGKEFAGLDGDVDIGASSIIGYSEFLEAGVYKDLEVPIFDPDEEGELDLEDREFLEEAAALIALPHKDTNDNEEWDFYPDETQEDFAFKDDEGDPQRFPPDERANDVAAVFPVREDPERFDNFRDD